MVSSDDSTQEYSITLQIILKSMFTLAKDQFLHI